MTTRGFYWFACRDFPEPYQRAPQLTPNVGMKQLGDDEDDARRQVEEIAREKAAAHLQPGETLEPITAKAYRFVPLTERKKPRA